MGKPFKKELESVYEILKWSNEIDISGFKGQVTQSMESPLLIVGSGGSLSACYYAARLAESNGRFSKALTPLELYSAQKVLRKSSVLFLSASGRNNDIRFAFKLAKEAEPVDVTSLTMRSNSPLSELSQKYTISECFEYDIPTGKDGFLATNSLIGFFAILNRAFVGEKELMIERVNDSLLKDINGFTDQISKDYALTVLSSGWSHPVALDIESKCTEAALIATLPADYRNFGHGRHHWFDKRLGKSAIIALINPENRFLAEKTLSLVPKEVPRLVLSTDLIDSQGSIDLLIKSFHLIGKLGEIQGIDPGRPGVPGYGRKLYNLRYSKSLKKETEGLYNKNVETIIQRKLQAVGSNSNNGIWLQRYNEFVRKLKRGKFGSIVFDYDGTLCSVENRFTGLENGMALRLVEILNSGFIIGIATGRGVSVRRDLRNVIPEKHWASIIVGYYNGGQIGFLSDEDIPNKKLTPDKTLVKAKKLLDANQLYKALNIDLRPHQITIEADDSMEWSSIRNFILEDIQEISNGELKVLESSHSMDIIPDRITKTKVVNECILELEKLNLPTDILCIGDRGKFPGNDYQLLQTEFSLSVDEVSNSSKTCWNLSKIGIKNTDATLFYLQKIALNDKFMSYRF